MTSILRNQLSYNTSKVSENYEGSYCAPPCDAESL